MTYSVGYWDDGVRVVLDDVDAYDSQTLVFERAACRVELSTVEEANRRNQ